MANVRGEQTSKELPKWLIRPANIRTHFNVRPRPPMVSTKRVIAGLVATIALAMLGWWLAGQEAQGRCEGILHEDDHAVWIGGEKDEGICIPANSKEVPKITSVCATEGYCVVIGRTEDCKDDTPKCTEINKVSSVTTGKPPRRP